MEPFSTQCIDVPLASLDREDTLTDFALSPVAAALEDSIRTSGIVHPVLLAAQDGGRRIVCGHRRIRCARALDLETLPARVIERALDDRERLRLNLSENRAHRVYSDVEKGGIIAKLTGAGVAPDAVISEYMPWIDLPRNKKSFGQLIRMQELAPRLRLLLHELNVPLRVFAPLLLWDAADRDAAFTVFSTLRPGASKWRDLLERVDEIAVKTDRPPHAVLNDAAVRTVLEQDGITAHEKYARIAQTLSEQRYPHWSGLRLKLAQAMDRLQLEPETKLSVQDSFESDAMRIEIRFSNAESLERQAAALTRASRSEAMAALIGIFKNLDG